MKNLIAAISVMLAFFASAQATSKGASAPDFQNGQIKVDTAGTGIAKWAVYRVENGSRQDPAIAKDFSTASGLSLGTYWVLGKKKTDAFGKFSLDTIVDISIAVDKDCDSLKVSFFSAMQMPDPQNPQNPQMLTCLSYSIQKAAGAFIDKIYIKEWNGMVSQYFGPSQGSCYPNLAQNAKIYAVFKDANGCSVVGTNDTQYKPTNYPAMTVPGTEPAPIKNHVTIGVADCSGYYIHYNDVQYKICNSGAARGMAHLDSIVVAGKFVSDCDYKDTMIYCQMYHPHAGYFWLDSMRAIAPKPAAKNCWDDHQFNITTLVWENKGSQPAKPKEAACWDDYKFDSISCSWKNNGTQPSQPATANCWDQYQFDSISCSWKNNGTQPSQPASTSCWDDYKFDSISCAWTNKGYQPTKPKEAACWDDYKFDSISCAWANKGTQPAMPTDTIYAYQFDSIKCAWNNAGLRDSSSLSLSEIEIGTAFYPNPFSDRIDIRIPAGSYGTLTSIEGKAVMRFEGSKALDTRSLEPGTYFIRISGGKKAYQLVKY